MAMSLPRLVVPVQEKRLSLFFQHTFSLMFWVSFNGSHEPHSLIHLGHASRSTWVGSKRQVRRVRLVGPTPNGCSSRPLGRGTAPPQRRLLHRTRMQTAGSQAQSLCQRPQGVGVWPRDGNRTVYYEVGTGRRASSGTTYVIREDVAMPLPTNGSLPRRFHYLGLPTDVSTISFGWDGPDSPAPSADILRYLASLRTEPEEE